MRILVAGVILLVIWCFVSAWLYNDNLIPAMKLPEPVLTIPETRSTEADSLMKLKASMPENILIYYEFDKTGFEPDQKINSTLNAFKTWLDKYPGTMLYVTGHTDLVGSVDYNFALALKRAQIVEKYLENQGINASRTIVTSKGETEPAADYLSDEGRAKNRRTEISIKMK